MRPAVSGLSMLWKCRFRLDECRYNIISLYYIYYIDIFIILYYLYFRQTGRGQDAKFSQAGIEFLRD